MSIVDLFQFPGDKVELIDCGKLKGAMSDFMLFKQTTDEGCVYHHVMIDSGPLKQISLTEWVESQNSEAPPYPGVHI